MAFCYEVKQEPSEGGLAPPKEGLHEKTKKSGEGKEDPNDL